MDNNFELKQLSNDTYELVLFNIWNNETMAQNIKELKKVKLSNKSKIQIDFKNLKECNSSAIIYLISFTKQFPSENIKLINLDLYENKYKIYEKHYQDNKQIEKKEIHFIEDIGRVANDFFLAFVDFTKFLGKIFYFFIYSLLNPRKM